MDGDSRQMDSREKVLGKLAGLHAGEETVYSGCVINCGAGHCVHRVTH